MVPGEDDPNMDIILNSLFNPFPPSLPLLNWDQAVMWEIGVKQGANIMQTYKKKKF